MNSLDKFDAGDGSRYAYAEVGKLSEKQVLEHTLGVPFGFFNL